MQNINDLLDLTSSALLIRATGFALVLSHSAQDELHGLAHDLAFRTAVWNRSWDQVIAERPSTEPALSRLIDSLTNDNANIEAFREGVAGVIERHVLHR